MTDDIPTNLRDRAAELDEYWSPKVVGLVNNQYLKVAKLKGDLAWHKHDEEDELFIILEGTLNMDYEDHTVVLEAGDFHIVPRGTLHNPICADECLVALVEPTTTRHTGNLETPKTKSIEDQLR